MNLVDAGYLYIDDLVQNCGNSIADTLQFFFQTHHGAKVKIIAF